MAKRSPNQGSGPSGKPNQGDTTFTSVQDEDGAGASPGAGSSSVDDALERRLGSHWLPRIGILIMVLGLVFLIVHAINEGWIPRTMQIVLGTTGGIVLAVVGDLLDRAERYGAYPQILIAGGASVVYFALFSAYAFESYRSALGASIEITIGNLALAALVLGAYASARDLPIFAVQAIFLTAITSLMPGPEVPFLRVAQLAGLSLVLSLAGMARRWRRASIANGLILFGTLAMFIPRGLDPGAILVGIGIALPGLVLAGLGLRERGEDVDDALVLQAGTPLLGAWVVGLFALAAGGWSSSQGWLTLGIGILGVSLSLIPVSTSTRIGWALVGVPALVAWPPIQFDGAVVAGVWMGFLLTAVAAQHVTRSRGVEVAGWVAATLATYHLFVFEAPRVHDGTIDPGVAAFLFVGSGLILLWGWANARSRMEGSPPAAAYLLAGVSLPVVYAGLAIESYGITIAWAMEGLFLVLVGFLLDGRDARFAGLGVLALVIGRVFFIDLASLEIVYRIVTFIVVGALILVSSFLYARFLPDEEERVAEEGA